MKRTLRWCGVLMASLIGLLGVTYALRSVILAPLIAQGLVATVEQDAGIGLSVGSVGGTYLTSLSLSDVRTVRPAARGPVRSAEVRSLRVSYNLFALASGIEPFLASITLDIDGARVEVDLEPETPEVGEAPADANVSAPVLLPGVLPAVRVRDTSVLLREPDYRVELSGIELDVQPRRGAPTPIRATVSGLTWEHPALVTGSVAVAAELAYSREQLLLRGLSVDGEPIAEDVQVGLVDLPGALPVGGRLQVFGGKAEFRARVEPTRLDARLTLAGLDLERVAALLRPSPPPLGGRLFAETSVQLDWEHPELLTAALTARLEGGRWQGAQMEHLALKAGAADGHARVERLQARLGENEAELRGVEVPLAPALAGDLAALINAGSAEFRVGIRDLPSLLTMAGIEVAAKSLPKLQLTLAGSAGNGQLEVEELLASSPENLVEVRGVSVSLEELVAGEVGALVRSSRGRFRADLRDIPTLAALGGVAVSRPTPVHRLLVTGEAGEGRVEIAGGRLTAGSAEVLLDRLRLDLSAAASDQDWLTANLEADLTVDLPDLGALLSLVGEPEATGSVRGRVSLGGVLGAPRGTARLEGRNLAWRALPLGTVSLEAASDQRSIEVLGLTLERGKDRVMGRGAFRLEEQRLDGVVLELSVEDLGFYARSLAPDLDLSGGRVTARLEAAGPVRAPVGNLSLQAGAATVAGVAVEQAVLEMQSDGGRVRFDQLELRTGEGELALAGTATLPAQDGSFELVLETLRLARGEVELALQAPARIAARTTGAVAMDSLALAGTVGTLALDGSFDPVGDVDLTIGIADLTGSGWLETLVGNRASFRGADLQARLTGSVALPVLVASGDVEELRLEGAPFPLRGSLDVGYGPGGISLRRLALQGDLGTGVSVTGEIPYDPLADEPLLSGPLGLQIVADVPSLGPLVSLFAPDLALDGFLKGSVDLGGTWDDPHGRVRFEGLNLTLPPTWKPQPPSPLAIQCALTLGGDRVELESLLVRAAELEASAAGTWGGAPPLARLLRGEVGVVAGDLSVQGTLNVPDLQWLSRDVEAMRRLAGGARGRISVEGPLADPVVTVVLELADGELLINGPTPGIRSLAGRVTADRTTVRLERMTGELGGAPFQISGQVVRSGDGEVLTDLTLQGDDLLLFRNDGVKLRADTALRVAGPLAALEITGGLAITDGRFVKNVDFLSLLQGRSPPKAQGGIQFFSFPDPPLRDARLDLAITAKAPFQIKNNLVRGGVRPDLRVTGTGEIPVVQGKIYVETTRLSLPAGRLVVQSGLVQFLPNAPDRPRLDLLAGARMIGYDITVQVEGPYDEPVVTLSSNPPLPNEDLLLLVFAGVPPRSLAEEGGARQSGMMMATYLGKGMLRGLVGDESTEAGESIVDRFDLVIGQGVTQQGEETIEVSFRLKENLLGKHDTLYLRSEKDIYDAYNAGVRIVFRFE